MSKKEHVCDHVCKYMKYCEAFPLGWQEEMERKAAEKAKKSPYGRNADVKKLTASDAKLLSKKPKPFKILVPTNIQYIIVNNCYGIKDGTIGELVRKDQEQWLIKFKKETCWVPAECCKKY